MDRNPNIYVIDDDASIRYLIKRVLQQKGYGIQLFPTGEMFLESNYAGNTACVITDLWLPGMNGIEIHDELLRRGHCVPVVAISSSPDVPSVVQFIKQGAVTVLQKPFSVEQLLSVVDQAVQDNEIRQVKDARVERIRNQLAMLSESEQRVMNSLFNGMSHKAISSALDVSPRTVDRYKQNILRKMESPTLQQLILTIADSRVV